jgi:alkylation response protein AidB-like acyl-CoA dehydrogenase
MRFAFDAQQLEFRRAVRELLEKECTPEHVRAAATGEPRSPERKRRLAEMGVLGLTAPAELGGSGGDEVDLVGLLEEAGRFALPESLVETTAVTIPLLRDFATSDDWIADLASGDVEVSIALSINGLALDADLADVLIVQRGAEIHAISQERATLMRQPSVDGTRRLFEIAWEPSPQTLLSEGREAVEISVDRGALGTAAMLVGLGARAIEMAAAYATERHQFGKPIGSFQAVKHRLADALLAIEFARPVVYRAAHSLAKDEPDRGRDVSMAKAMASDAAMAAVKAALQVHGAIGYTEEADLHLWLKRAIALSSAWGDASRHRARVATTLLGS